MADSSYLKKDKYGNEYFDIHTYEDDEQMSELIRMRQEKEKRKVASHGVFARLGRIFSRQKTL